MRALNSKISTLGLLACCLITLSTMSTKAVANACVAETKYPSRLANPTVEAWASQSPIFTYENDSEIECKMATELSQLFTTIQGQLAQTSPDHKKLRGTHAKGICLNGTFKTEFESTLNAKQLAILNQAGLFATQGELPAQYRFANADSKINPDWIADVRALSAKISLPGGGRQDFAFNNVPRFQIDSLENFVKLMEMQTAIHNHEIATDSSGAPTLGGLLSFFNKLYGPLEAGRTLNDLNSIKSMADADKTWHGSYATQNYWSTTTFGLGWTNPTPVKFGALPCGTYDANKSRLPIASSKLGRVELKSEAEAKSLAENLVSVGLVSHPENYLSEGLISDLNAAPVCYYLFVQFLDEERSITHDFSPSVLVENPTKVWNAPIHLVGKIKITDAIDQATCDDPKNAVSVMNNSSGIQGLGQINRARELAESASWKNR